MADAAAEVPAGWYDDGQTTGVLRWWDGIAWTDHTAAAEAEPTNSSRPLIPSERAVYGPFIWMIVLLPLLSALTLFLPDFGQLADRLIGLVLGATTVVLAARDRAWLLGQGVVRPFHWAWSFLGGIVYVIGRSVIVRRVAAPEGLAPIWVSIGVVVAFFVAIIAWVLIDFA